MCYNISMSIENKELPGCNPILLAHRLARKLGFRKRIPQYPTSGSGEDIFLAIDPVTRETYVLGKDIRNIKFQTEGVEVVSAANRPYYPRI